MKQGFINHCIFPPFKKKKKKGESHPAGGSSMCPSLLLAVCLSEVRSPLSLDVLVIRICILRLEPCPP